MRIMEIITVYVLNMILFLKTVKVWLNKICFVQSISKYSLGPYLTVLV